MVDNNQDTYCSLLYIYIQTVKGKVSTSVLLFYGFGILNYLSFPFDSIESGKLYKCGDLKDKAASFLFRQFVVYLNNLYFVTAN